jgi:hypothetical protein
MDRLNATEGLVCKVINEKNPYLELIRIFLPNFQIQE